MNVICLMKSLTVPWNGLKWNRQGVWSIRSPEANLMLIYLMIASFIKQSTHSRSSFKCSLSFRFSCLVFSRSSSNFSQSGAIDFSWVCRCVIFCLVDSQKSLNSFFTSSHLWGQKWKRIGKLNHLVPILGNLLDDRLEQLNPKKFQLKITRI